MFAVLVLGCDERKFFDEYCYAPHRPPDTTEPYVGLFHRDGRPLLRPARVQVTYGAGTTELPVNPRLAAELLSNGRQVEYVVMPPDRAGNLYTFLPNSRQIAMYPCALALQYRVEADGCVPVSGSHSWNDNTYPGRLDINFHLPLRLDCTGEDPSPDAATPADATP